MNQEKLDYQLTKEFLHLKRQNIYTYMVIRSQLLNFTEEELITYYSDKNLFEKFLLSINEILSDEDFLLADDDIGKKLSNLISERHWDFSKEDKETISCINKILSDINAAKSLPVEEKKQRKSKFFEEEVNRRKMPKILNLATEDFILTSIVLDPLYAKPIFYGRMDEIFDKISINLLSTINLLTSFYKNTGDQEMKDNLASTVAVAKILHIPIKEDKPFAKIIRNKIFDKYVKNTIERVSNIKDNNNLESINDKVYKKI